ncbi:MAG TPA: ABC transporter permease [Vicinamibacterales bacterium]|nr:ABC transporter permease [Vicinamibacterales bacterium]
MTPNDREIQQELEAHLERSIQDLIGAGWPPEAARAEAARRFGDLRARRLECAAERDRAARIAPWRAWLADFGRGCRAVRRRPGAAAQMTAMLMLGIALIGAIVAIVHGALLRPLPFPAPAQLVAVWGVNDAQQETRGHFSPADLSDLQTITRRAGLSWLGYMSWPVSLTDIDEPERLEGALVTPEFFDTLGVPPARGRGFSGLNAVDLSTTVVISARLAARLGDAAAPGRSLRMNGGLMTVAGVMSPSFAFPAADTDVWVPLVLTGENATNRASRWLKVVARLAPAQSFDDGQARLTQAMAQLATAYPSTNASWTARAVPLHTEMFGPSRLPVLALAASVLALVLVTGANLTSVAIGRLLQRLPELHLLLALGATRASIVRQLALESGLVAAAAAAFGIPIGLGVVLMVRNLAPQALTQLAGYDATTTVTVVGMVAAAVGAAWLGAVPILARPWWTASADSTRSGRATSAGVRRQRWLVIVQTAFVGALLSLATAFESVYAQLARTDLGIATHGILTLRLQAPRSRAATNEAQATYFDAIFERVAHAPGVSAVAAISDLPLRGNTVSLPIAIEGRPKPPGQAEPLAALRIVTANYLEVVRTPLRRGRFFHSLDLPTSPNVAIINDAAAQRFWPGRDAIGARFRIGGDQDWRTVVGVVDDVHHDGPTQVEGPAVYVPHRQKAETWLTWMWLVVRSDNPRATLSAIRPAIASVDRNQPVSQVADLDDLAAASVAVPRLTALAALVTALATLTLAAAGAGAVLRQSMSLRRREFAVRLALGAPPRTLTGLPVLDAVGLVGSGGAAGVMIAFAGLRLLGSRLPDLPAFRSETALVPGAVLLIVAIVIAIGPARRLARLQTADILRQ